MDDHSRLAYAEILPDEKGSTCAGFLLRAAEFFTSHGIMAGEIITDNAKNYISSKDVADAVATLDVTHLRIKQHCPWQNGKVERFNRTLQTEWAYRQVVTSNEQRTQAVDPWLHFYNTERRNSAIGGKPPASPSHQPDC